MRMQKVKMNKRDIEALNYILNYACDSYIEIILQKSFERRKIWFEEVLGKLFNYRYVFKYMHYQKQNLPQNIKKKICPYLKI